MSEDKNVKPQTSQFPIDLATASKVQLVKQTDAKGQTTTHQTFRTLNQPMRVVTMPATGVASPGQIIQTHIVPPAILKAGPAGLQNRSIQSTITVSKAPTTYHISQRNTANLASIQGAKNTITPIRTPTPPASGTVTSTLPAFVRTTMTPRTSSPTTTVSVLSPGAGTTWVGGAAAVQVQLPTQILRSNLGQNRTRVVQSIQTGGGGAGNQTITNIYGTQSANQTLSTGNSTISVSTTTTATGQQQYVATVLPRSQATLVYTNTNSQQQPFIAGQQRLGIVSTANQRQVRPMHRIPSNIRVAPNAISIRTPVLTPTTVLSTLPQAGQNRGTTVQSSSTQFAGSMPTRIIQVQSQGSAGGQGTVSGGGNSGTTAQVNQKLIPNMMVPILVNNNRNKSSLAIAHVSKLPATTGSASPANDATTSIASSVPSIVGTAIQQVGSGTGNQGGNTYQQSGPSINQIIVSQQQLQQHQQPSGLAAAVLPLAITSRGNTIPIKTISMAGENRTITTNTSSSGATILPITKIISQSQSNQSGEGGHPAPIYIHTRIPAVSTVSASTTGTGGQGVNGSSNTSSGTTIFSSSGTVFYEHVPATSTAASSAAPTTVSSENKAIQFTQPQGSFAVVSTARPIGHIQSILSNPGGGNSTVRFNTMNVVESGGHVVGQQQSGQTQAQSQAQQSHQIISMAHSQAGGQQNESPTHMIIQRAGKSDAGASIGVVTTGPGTGTQIKISGKKFANTAQRPTPINRNLITQMLARAQTPPTMQVQSQVVPQVTPQLIAAAAAAQPGPVAIESDGKRGEEFSNLMRMFSPRPQEAAPSSEAKEESHERRYSSDGSTTISAPQSPRDDVEDDEMDNEIFISRIRNEHLSSTSATAILGNQQAGNKQPFKYNLMIQQSQGQVGDVEKKKKNLVMHNYSFGGDSEASTSAGPSGLKHLTEFRDEGPKKKVKKPSTFSKPELPIDEGASTSATDVNNENQNEGPREVIFKKPTTVTLLQSYKQNWKPANNHFQRWSDVRPREERKPSAVDIANQPNIIQRIKGWKIVHLNGQLEEMIENEQEVYNKLEAQLKYFEEDDASQEMEKIADLIKGNMQRSKIIIDNVAEAKTQINKIFEYQDHAAEIINRCSSKRNFKKREKN